MSEVGGTKFVPHLRRCHLQLSVGREEGQETLVFWGQTVTPERIIYNTPRGLIIDYLYTQKCKNITFLA